MAGESADFLTGFPIPKAERSVAMCGETRRPWAECGVVHRSGLDAENPPRISRFHVPDPDGRVRNRSHGESAIQRNGNTLDDVGRAEEAVDLLSHSQGRDDAWASPMGIRREGPGVERSGSRSRAGGQRGLLPVQADRGQVPAEESQVPDLDLVALAANGELTVVRAEREVIDDAGTKAFPSSPVPGSSRHRPGRTSRADWAMAIIAPSLVKAIAPRVIPAWSREIDGPGSQDPTFQNR